MIGSGNEILGYSGAISLLPPYSPATLCPKIYASGHIETFMYALLQRNSIELLRGPYEA
ncbi:hypothetical protein [Endozoicomonas euniceicola]|uniref:Uncharacterized protein n=1 Tax=Endozoicomonas euniceicola TaxID=1234143 RepID=A0ABY6GU67_9GAMM|nr:hypothetical protein [Endozoicomonas euniceicola]UYM16317.1 hypothetical protein NX720_26575 [Endozoicomonas euniceicola]